MKVSATVRSTVRGLARRPSIYRIAREAGCSIATVSRVLNNRARVAGPTRRAVLKCMRRLNYVPRLRLNRRTSLGVLMEYSGAAMTHYVAEILNGAAAAAAARGVRLSIFSLFDKDVGSEGLLEYLRDNEIDALLVLLSNDRSLYLDRLADEQYPCLVVNNRRAGRVNYLDADNVRGAELAIDHLAHLGHRRILFLSDSCADHVNFRDRLRGYRNSLRRHGIGFDAALAPEESSAAAAPDHLHLGYRRLRGALAAGIEFTAVFCATDDLAFGASRALTEAGLEIPRDVSLVGFDDYGVSEFVRPPLTTVRQPLKRMGETAVEEVLRLAAEGADQPRPLRRIFAPELVIRQSTAPPRAGQKTNQMTAEPSGGKR